MHQEFSSSLLPNFERAEMRESIFYDLKPARFLLELTLKILGGLKMYFQYAHNCCFCLKVIEGMMCLQEHLRSTMDTQLAAYKTHGDELVEVSDAIVSFRDAMKKFRSGQS